MDELLDCKLIWEKAQPEIKEGMTEMSYSLWISGLEPVCILSDMLILQSMNEVTLDTLKSLYSDQIADALSHASGVNLRPMFICGDERPKYEKLMAGKKAPQRVPAGPPLHLRYLRNRRQQQYSLRRGKGCGGPAGEGI